jgi:hypothetical protein
VPNNHFYRQYQAALEDANQGFKLIFIISLALNLFMVGDGIKYMMFLIRALQILFHLPIMRIPVPGDTLMMI